MERSQNISYITGEINTLPAYTNISARAFESLTLTAELEKRMQFFKMRCWQSLLNIINKDHEDVRKKIQAAIGKYYSPLKDPSSYWKILRTPEKRKLGWIGQIARSSGLSKDDSTGQNAKKKKNNIKNEQG